MVFGHHRLHRHIQPGRGVDADAGTTGLSRTITDLTNGTAYTFTVTATNGVGTGTASASSNSVTPMIDQAITFDAAPTVVVGGNGTVSATGGASGNAVTFTSTTTGIRTVSGSTVTGVTAGTCTIAANQTGNANYNAATEVTQDITIEINGPKAPTVTGTTPTNNSTPTWSWTAGGGGNGTFRYKLDGDSLLTAANSTTTTATSLTPATALTDGLHFLYVQESDGAGNWSTTSSFTIEVDSTLNNPPSLTGNETPSTDPTVNCYTWTWTSQGGTGNFRYKPKHPASII